MTKKLVHEIVYKKRLVAFLDVMGFKTLLGEDQKSIDILQDFYGRAIKALKFLKEGDFGSLPNDLQSIFVSDAIVVSTELPQDLETAARTTLIFFQKIGFLQAILAMESNIWIRGAVSIGNLHIDEDKNILVGPAFVRAYNLEATADFPRIIIDPLVCRHFDLLPHQLVEKMNSTKLKILLAFGDGADAAIQIDWFLVAVLFEKWDYIPFFADLKSRMTLDQSIFTKSRKMLTYFRQSLLEFEQVSKERTKQLDLKLKEFGV